MAVSNPDRKHDYVIVPDFERVRTSDYFRGKTSRTRNFFFQIIYFFWKQLVLPFLAWRHRADVIFCSDFMVPAFKSRAIKIPVMHDAFFWESPQNYNYWWLKYYLTFVKWGLRGRSKIVTTSHYSAGQLKKHLPRGATYEIVYQGSRFGQSPSNLSFNKWQLRQQKYFLHVGVFEKRKNLGVLIEAFAEFKKIHGTEEVKVVLAGQKGPRKDLDDYDTVLRQIRLRGMEQLIVLPGYVTKGELQQLYGNALAYVFPSTNEGFGLPILEAFSHKIPVIVSESGALPEIGGNAVLTFKTYDPKDLLNKMMLVYESEELRSELSRKGTQRLKEFSWDKFFSQLEKVFEFDSQ